VTDSFIVIPYKNEQYKRLSFFFFSFFILYSLDTMTYNSNVYAQEKYWEAVSKAENVKEDIQWAIRKHRQAQSVENHMERLLDIEKAVKELEDKMSTLTSTDEFEGSISLLMDYLDEAKMIKEELLQLDQDSDY
jgi:hypothetical protein